MDTIEAPLMRLGTTAALPPDADQTSYAPDHSGMDDETAEAPSPADSQVGSTPEAGARQPARQSHKQKGLLIVNTGNGKGKTTAALGVILRAWGRNLRVGG